MLSKYLAATAHSFRGVFAAHSRAPGLTASANANCRAWITLCLEERASTALPSLPRSPAKGVRESPAKSFYHVNLFLAVLPKGQQVFTLYTLKDLFSHISGVLKWNGQRTNRINPATGLEKVSFLSYPKERKCQKSSNYHTIALISHTSKVMLKILQARLQQCVNRELTDVQAGFRKGRGTRWNCQHPLDHWKSKRVPEKHLLLLYWLCQSLWLCGSQQTEKFFKKWEDQTTWSASWEMCMQVRKQ